MVSLSAPASSFTPAATAAAVARLLVVDDVAEDRQLLCDFLRQQGYRLYVGVDGHEAYEKALAAQPDLILLDVYMPGCDGMAACRRLKTDPRTQHIPVIFLTAANAIEDRIAGLALGAVDYVGKPFDFEEVRLRLRIHLASRLVATSTHEPLGPASLDEVLFATARRVLDESLDTPPSLAELAKAVGTNTRRLTEAFKRCSGSTVFDFLREERLKEGRRLLAETALEIQSIATQLGYNSAANFSTAFRERFGLTPSDFRRASRGA